MVVPVSAQSGAFGGFGSVSQSMLGRGSTAGFDSEVVAIRPWVTATGSYFQSSFPGSGGFQTTESWSAGLGFGVGGGKRWENTSMALMYAGRAAYVEGVSGLSRWSNVLSLGVTHRASPQTSIQTSLVAGYSSGGYGFGAGFGGIGMGTPWGMGGVMGSGVSGADYGNPADNGLVDMEIYDVPVLFVGASAGVSHMISPRFGVQGGVGIFSSQRRYAGLFDNRGISGNGGMFYRLDDRSSIGAGYGYTRFEYSGVFGGNQAQSVNIGYSRAFTPRTFFNIGVGGYNFRSNFIGAVPVDDAIQDLFGTTSDFYEIRKVSRMGVGGETSIWHHFRTVMAGVSYRRALSPGNGVLLASWRDSVFASASRPLGSRASLGAALSYGRLTGIQQSGYRSEFYTASANVAFRLVRNLGVVTGGGYRRTLLSSGNKTDGWFVNAGLSWSPDAIPLTF
jgi:hypothetical protein